MAAPTEHMTAVCAELESWVREDWRVEELRGANGVRRITELFRQPEYREAADEEIFTLILQMLSRALQEIPTQIVPSVEHWFDLTAECFRCLRNACVQCPPNQNTIRNMGLIEKATTLITVLSTSDYSQESCLVAFRCGLQFLGNVAGGNKDSQNSIWKHAFPHLFLNCLTHEDDKVSAYASMVLYTCMDEDKMADLLEPANLNVSLGVITAYSKQSDAEWLHLIVTDRFLRCPELVKQMYASQSHADRLTLLELILSKINEKSSLTKTEMTSLQQIAEFLSDCFQKQSKAVLILVSPGDREEEEALVVIRLLDLLCEMTSDADHLTGLQSYPGLLDTVVETLRLTHLAGKQSKNVFTSTHSASLGIDLTHAAVGFKAHLIRLIANLCYRNRENQDKIWQLDGIPIILDNCSIDDNNPFLNQWAVYAIRNLTEHNEKNQELIASMERQGLADTALLENMGLHVEERDGKLVLKSVKKN
ncbi:ataxin-10 isoform X2 [Bufo bufo]|uniref:ataxin-10 isoform X2 n=1 Tax=Bufo bufo TaxID=8384 RepID=UPI001ABDCAD4|nr:ataxin-10 isoform X2 [Bufo bufo]